MKKPLCLAVCLLAFQVSAQMQIGIVGLASGVNITNSMIVIKFPAYVVDYFATSSSWGIYDYNGNPYSSPLIALPSVSGNVINLDASILEYLGSPSEMRVLGNWFNLLTAPAVTVDFQTGVVSDYVGFAYLTNTVYVTNTSTVLVANGADSPVPVVVVQDFQSGQVDYWNCVEAGMATGFMFFGFGMIFRMAKKVGSNYD